MTPRNSIHPRQLQSIVFLVLLLLLSLLAGCAGQVPPDGGPVDREPPRIISTYPMQYATRFRDNRIALEFDEYVDRRSVQESIFISPYVGELEFEWSGREVEIRFSEPLQENRTYVVNVGTDVVDLNNRNRMAQAFTLAFSTGDVIDRGSIEGRVYGQTSNDSPEGVMVFAYVLLPGAPDTLNPRTTKPDYITQTGKTGEFALRHLLLGKYRLLAVRDEYRNLLYDPEADEYGILPYDVQLSMLDTVRRGVTMRLAKEDTTAPRLLRVTAQNCRRLVLEFSEAIDTATVTPSAVTIRDTVENASVAVRYAVPLLSKPSTLLVLTDSLHENRGYRLTVKGIRDQAGNLVHPLAHSVTFSGSSLPDTARPSIESFSISDSTRGVELQPTFVLAFSDVMETTSVEQAIIVRDSAGLRVLLSLRKLHDAAWELRFPQPLRSLTWYVVTVDATAVRNAQGRTGAGPQRTFRFQTLDVEQLSSIEGRVIDRSVTDTTGTIVLIAENLGASSQRTFTMQLSEPGEFAFRNLGEGQYLLRVYRDRNRNGVFDAGLPFPFRPSERFVVYPDTLKLRARWPLEGVTVELK